MKLTKITLSILILITLSTLTFAQETPAGKKFAETFWKAISEGRENAAKSSLDSIKRREPNFDASKMEQALSELKGKITSKEKREETQTVQTSTLATFWKSFSKAIFKLIVSQNMMRFNPRSPNPKS